MNFFFFHSCSIPLVSETWEENRERETFACKALLTSLIYSSLCKIHNNNNYKLIHLLRGSSHHFIGKSHQESARVPFETVLAIKLICALWAGRGCILLFLKKIIVVKISGKDMSLRLTKSWN